MSESIRPMSAGVARELSELGCDLTRPAFAYKASSVGSHFAPAAEFTEDLVPGFAETGFGSAGCSIVVARDGTLLMAPAFGEAGVGILRSHDDGRTWEQVVPQFAEGGHSRRDVALFMDVVTERILLLSRGRAGFDLTLSDDQGETWQHAALTSGARDPLAIFSGPRVAPEPTGCQSVLYAAGPRELHRSLDGGSTWEPRRASGAGGAGVAGPDGTLFMGVTTGRSPGLLVSRDEGDTWFLREVPGARLTREDSGVSPVVDAAGNLYAVWPDARGVLLQAVSRDQGETWSESVVVSAPGVRRVACVTAAAHASRPGRIAIAYYGTTGGRACLGYVAETRDALAAEPVFRTQTVDRPSEALHPRGAGSGRAVRWFGEPPGPTQVVFGPDGTIYAALCRSMRRRDGWGARAHGSSRQQLMLARLAGVPKGPAEPAVAG